MVVSIALILLDNLVKAFDLVELPVVGLVVFEKKFYHPFDFPMK